MRTVKLPGGGEMPALGLGTWRMGEKAGARSAEIAALRAGLDAGIGLIDTAEMYGEGGAEEVVREAMVGRRDSIYLVSKVYPHNASCTGAIAACERSLKRLATDRLDLYLLHWRGSIPLAETIEAFETLRAAGKIRRWGVSNFDLDDMADLAKLPAGSKCATNQVLYHLGERGIEWQLLPDSQRPNSQREAMPVMAYSPLGQGAILGHEALRDVAARHATTPAAIAIAWTLHQPGVVSIPKTSRAARVPEIVAAARVILNPADLADLHRAFPKPTKAAPLAML